MKSEEVKHRIDTIYWVCNVALITYQRYIAILQSEMFFSICYPQTNFVNPIIKHSIIDDNGGIIFDEFATSKKEILTKGNHDLYKAWQIVYGIVAMTSVLDKYLKDKAEIKSKMKQNVTGIFDRFSKITDIELTDFIDYPVLKKYHAVRDISLHNLGRKNDRFYRKLGLSQGNNEAYVVFPQDLILYKKTINNLIDFIEHNEKLKG